MPALTKCSECKRMGGYTSDLKSGTCERCLTIAATDKSSDDDNDDDDE